MTDQTPIAERNLFQVGDIVESVFWQGRYYPGESLIRSGLYRIVEREKIDPAPHFLAQINQIKDAPLPPPNWCFVVVHHGIPVGAERKTDHRFLNNYLPSLHPKIMRSAWQGDGDYLIRCGAATGAQTTLF